MKILCFLIEMEHKSSFFLYHVVRTQLVALKKYNKKMWDFWWNWRNSSRIHLVWFMFDDNDQDKLNWNLSEWHSRTSSRTIQIIEKIASHCTWMNLWKILNIEYFNLSFQWIRNKIWDLICWLIKTSSSNYWF